MREGLLWFDNDPQRKLDEKINRAALRYQVKFGCKPTVCYVNALDCNGQAETAGGIRLRPAMDVQRHHFWIGVEQEGSAAKAA